MPKLIGGAAVIVGLVAAWVLVELLPTDYSLTWTSADETETATAGHSELATLRRMRREAKNGDPYAQLRVGAMYHEGVGTLPDKQEARKWFDKAVPVIRDKATKGDAEAQYHLGNCYANGWRVPYDMGRAFSWWLLAARQDHVEAMYRVVMEDLGSKLQPSERFEFIRKAAEGGHREAMFELGKFYHFGYRRGSHAEADMWYAKAIEQFTKKFEKDQDPKAAYMLWVCYSRGLGVKADVDGAQKWYEASQKAADEVGSLDPRLSHWNVTETLEKAEAGDPYAQLAMGFHADDGWNAPSNLELATKWYTAAAEQGHKKAKEKLELIKEDLAIKKLSGKS